MWRILFGFSSVCALLAAETPVEFFEKQVRPVLADRCYGCHSASSQPVMGGFRIDSREGVLKGGSRGPAVVPGNAAASRLVEAVRYEGALKMPPTGKLRDAEIAVLAEWVQKGAEWGYKERTSTRPLATKFWSFQPVREPELPAVTNQGWVSNPIDRFIAAGLEKKGLQPNGRADKRALIRRATFDLIGLPPTPEEVRAFLKDDSPQAFARVVDRLLDSPRYGERWGRHWLDVSRYGDSNGLDENLVFINAWRYRDYVIKSFNEDKPYDQFVHEQLAGDLLPRTGKADRDYEQLIATGFLSLGAKMLAEDDPVKMEMDIVDEQVDTMAKAFMGLTLGCARCHDHKFDPIPSADYYSLAGIFRSTKTMENFKVVAKWHEHVLAPDEDRERLRAHEKRIEGKRKELEGYTKPANQELQREARKRVTDYLMAAADLLRREELKLSHWTGEGAHTFEVTVEEGKEFTFEAPKAGLYQVELHYSSAEARPVSLHINGDLMKSKALAGATGTASPDTWSVEGAFELLAGTNTMKLVRPGKFFPKVDKLLIAPVTIPDEKLPKTEQQLAKQHAVNPEFLRQMTDYLRRTHDDPNSVLKAWHQARAAEQARMKAGLQSEFEAADAAATPDARQKLLKEVLHDKFGPFAVPGNTSRYYAAETAAKVKALEGEIKDLEKATPTYPRAMGVTDGKVADLRIHLRGNHLTLGDEVPRRFLRVIAGEQQQPLGTQSSGRLELANWLTSPSHPLTSRVMVNRLWRWHFGKGIVPSVDNFGRLGEAPTNQELLDWLAVQFVKSGWSIKQMHRLMMLSSTYQMSAAHNENAYEADPENKLLWKANRRRLEAESIRDSLFAVSGMLDSSSGGTMLKFKEREYVTSTENRDSTDYDTARRAVYLPVIRSSLYDVFQAFDFGDPSVLNGDRPATIVAPQALFMMNGSPVAKATKYMAENLLKESSDPAERVTAAFERAFGRLPSASEKDRSLSFVAKAEAAYEKHETDPAKRRLRAWQSLCRALMETNEFIYVE